MDLISYVVKVLLVEALLVYLSPGHWEKKWSIPKARDSTENICRQVFSVEAEHVFSHDCVLYT